MTPSRVLLAGTILLGVWAAGVAGQDNSCEPSCPRNCTPGDKVPNPRDCGQYYTCLQNCEPSDQVFECPEGLKFDTVTAECQPSTGNVTCGYCIPRCRYTCEGHEGLAAIRGDCSNALLCAASPPLTITCGTQYFNGTACQDDVTQCCDPCEVFCEAPFTEVMDPKDCTYYYYCAQVGYPQEEDRYKCPDGENFNGQVCEAGAECTQFIECIGIIG